MLVPLAWVRRRQHAFSNYASDLLHVCADMGGMIALQSMMAQPCMQTC